MRYGAIAFWDVLEADPMAKFENTQTWALNLDLICTVCSNPSRHVGALRPGESLIGSFWSRYLPCGTAVSESLIELASFLLGLLSEKLIGNPFVTVSPSWRCCVRASHQPFWLSRVFFALTLTSGEYLQPDFKDSRIWWYDYRAHIPRVDRLQ